MHLIASLLRWFFQLLYHQFAWSYDLVSAVVSLGHWGEWVRSVIPHLEGHVLEIGYGPGHLQVTLRQRGMSVFGIDESRQMSRQAACRLMKLRLPAHLSCGRAENLPFAPSTFNSVVATFPSEYIFDTHTLKEIRRVLVPGGRLVILPMAWITGGSILEKLAAWIFRITGEAPGKPHPVQPQVQERFQRAGFIAESEVTRLKGSEVLIIIASSTLAPEKATNPAG